MKASKTELLSNSRGFTMIELLISVAIIGVLAALSMSAFFIYKNDAEYAKAETDLRNARTAFEAGIQDDPSGSLALAFTGTGGGVLPVAMQNVLPNAMTSKDVKLGVQYDACPAGGGAGVLSQYLVATSCNAHRAAMWTRFCDGIEVFVGEVPGAC